MLKCCSRTQLGIDGGDRVYWVNLDTGYLERPPTAQGWKGTGTAKADKDVEEGKPENTKGGKVWAMNNVKLYTF